MKIVDTEQFWKLMCKPAAIRKDRNTIYVGADEFMTFSPPDDDFLLSKVEESANLLGFKKNKLSRLRFLFEKLF